jgi:hypothetical protein
MAKDHSLMIVHCLVPTSQTHTLDRVLQEIGAREIMFRPYQNGPAPPATNGAAKEPIGKGKARLAMNGKVISKVAMSNLQSEWIKKHVTKEVHATDLAEAWAKAGFKGKFLKAALMRAASRKIIKRTAPATYRPV